MSNNRTGYFVKNGIIYVQGSVNGIFYRKSTKKQATKPNILWIKKNSQSVLLQLIEQPSNSSNFILEEFGYKSLEINSFNRKENTNKDYKMTFEKHILPYFRTWELQQIRPTDLKQWQNKLTQQVSGKRVMNIRTVFRGILQDAFIDEIIDLNPFDRVKPPKTVKPIIQPFSLDDVELIIANANGWFKNYLLIAFFTGMRVGEIMALHWSDIDMSREVISVSRSMTKGILSTPKTAQSIREIDMLPVVRDALINQSVYSKRISEFVFVNQYGNNFTDSSAFLRHHWKPLIEKIGIMYRILYQTRHTFASIMLQQGEEIGWVSQMMSHTDINTTFTKYASFIPRKQKQRAKFINNLSFWNLANCKKTAN